MSTTCRATDSEWMDRALALAAKGRYGASPNPMVGAVVLAADGQLAGTGYHAAFGGDHAEVVALREAGAAANGGTIYVTLEPCNHHGKTPPCVDAVLAAGIRRVVVASRDPNPSAAGGLERLAAAGVRVTTGVAEQRARALNHRWLRLITGKRPSVTLKAAVSLDGRIATRTGHSQWITGDQARHRSLELREEHDAILVGVGTVLADDPRLTRRLGLNPVARWRRIILDSTLRTPADAVVVRSDPQLTTLAHLATAPGERQQRLAAAGVHLLPLPATATGQVALPPLLSALAADGIAALLVEGGATVNGSFLDADLIDEIVVFLAPIIIGGPAPAMVAGIGAASLQAAPRFSIMELAQHGSDIAVHGLRSRDDRPAESGAQRRHAPS